MVMLRVDHTFKELFNMIAEDKARYIVKYKMRKGEGFPIHYHPINEYIVTLDGAFLLFYANRQHKIEGQHLIFIPRRVPHSLEIISQYGEYVVIRESDDEYIVI